MKGFIALVVFQVVFGLCVLGCYAGNIVRIIQCDWSSSGSYKGEIIHCIGAITPAFLVTVWFDDK